MRTRDRFGRAGRAVAASVLALVLPVGLLAIQAQPALAAVVVSVAPNTGLVDGQSVAVSADVAPGASVLLLQCRAILDTSGSYCDLGTQRAVIADAVGHVAETMPVKVALSTASGSFDCRTAANYCVIAAAVLSPVLEYDFEYLQFAGDPSPAAVHGVVSDPDGFPVAGATVEAVAFALTTTTAADGTYALEFPVGSSLLRATGPAGGPYGSREVYREFSGEVVVDFVLPRVAALSGVVRDADGTAIAGATVAIEMPGCLPCATTSGADGAYRFDRLADGGFTLTVRLDGSFLVPAVHYGYLNENEQLVVDPVLTPGGRVHGTLERHDGTPFITDAVTLCDPERCVEATVVDSEYTFPDAIPPAIYDAQVWSDDGGFVIVGVEVVVGEDREVVLRQPAPGAIRGVLRTHAGLAVGGARVFACGVFTCAEATTDGAGSFELLDLTPGDFHVSAEAPAGVLGTRADADAVVSSGETATVDLMLGPAGGLAGTLEGPAGLAYVSACPSDGGWCAYGPPTTIGAGPTPFDLAVPLAPGTYDVVAYGEGGATARIDGVVIRDGEIAAVVLHLRLDSDHDGVADDDEQQAAGGGDGNDDGVEDRFQAQVASVVTVGGPVTVVSDGVSFARVGTLSVASESLPAGHSAPYGAIDFAFYGGGLHRARILTPDAVTDAFQVVDGAVTSFGFDGVTGGVVGPTGTRTSLRLVGGKRGDVDPGFGVRHVAVPVLDGPPTSANIVTGPDGFRAGTTETIAFEVPAGTNAMCSLDWQPFVACDTNASETVEGLAIGWHQLVVVPEAGGHAGRGDFRIWYRNGVGTSLAMAGASGITTEVSPTFSASGAVSVRCGLLFSATTVDCSTPVTFGPHGNDAVMVVAYGYDATDVLVSADFRYFAVIEAAAPT